ncbi:MAG TPA: MFS transporter [Methanomassiliicoccales archaeon]|jgi:predicted MFS family arabinose efflux permease
MKRGVFFGVPYKVRWIIYLSCFSAVANGYLTMVISAYLPEIGISSSDIGLLLGVNGVGMIITAIPFGILADRIGRKRILVVSLSLIPLTLLIYAFTTDFTFLLIGAITAGAAEGAFLSAWNAMIADLTTVGNRTKAFSMSFIINGGFTSLGFTLPFLIPFLIPVTGWSSFSLHSAFFVFLAALAAISPIMLHRLLKDMKENLRKRIPGEKKLARIKGPYMRRMLKFSIFNSLIGLGAGLVIPLVPTWLYLKYGVPDSLTGPLLAVCSISIGLASLFSGRIAEKYGPVKAIAFTQGTSTIFMLAIPFMPGAAPAAVVYFIRAALMNMAGPILDSYLMGIITPEERGLASAINSIIWRIPNSVSTVIGGLMFAAGMFELPFIIAAILYIVAISAFFINFRNVRPLDEQGEVQRAPL